MTFFSSVFLGLASPEWGGDWSRFAWFGLPSLILPGFLIADVLTVMSVFHGSPRAARLYRAALGIVGLGHLLLALAGSWWFAMAGALEWGGPFLILVLLPISTAFVLTAPLWGARASRTPPEV